MKTFSYSGYNAEGSKAEGMVEALNLKMAREHLLRQGIYTKHLSDVDLETGNRFSKKVPPSLRAQAYRELATLVHAGNALDDSISLLLETSEFGKASLVVARLRDKVRSGAPFSIALEEISDGWKDYEGAILEVGEETGMLAQSMNTLAEFIEEEEVWKEQTKTALLYPLLILFFAILIVGACSLWLLPVFQRTLIEAGLDLPAWTKILMHLGSFLSLGALILGALAILARKRIKEIFVRHEVSCSLEKILCRIPLCKNFLQAMVTYRFCRAYSALLHGGILLVDGFPLAIRASGSRWMNQTSEEGYESLKRGEPLSNVLARLPWVSSSLPGWIRAGEESGAVGDMLTQAGERAQRKADRTRERSLKLLEPLMIVIMGLFILGLSFAMLGPILSLNDSLLQ